MVVLTPDSGELAPDWHPQCQGKRDSVGISQLPILARHDTSSKNENLRITLGEHFARPQDRRVWSEPHVDQTPDLERDLQWQRAAGRPRPLSIEATEEQESDMKYLTAVAITCAR
jgi:hypothetical protein